MEFIPFLCIGMPIFVVIIAVVDMIQWRKDVR